MRILVAGKNGQVGFELNKILQSTSHDFVCLDRTELNITCRESIEAAIKSFKPNCVINATAYTAVDKAETERDLATAVNETGPKYLAQLCTEYGASLLHISTDYVFAGDAKEPYKETDPVAPTGHYGASKLAGERAIVENCPNYIILRTAWVFGAHGNNFVKTMLRVAQSRDTLGVVVDQLGSPTSAAGIANTLISIAEQIESGNQHWGIYHYSGQPYTSWHGFAEYIFKEAYELNLLPHKITVNAISTEEYPTTAKRPANSMLDCNKIYETFGVNSDDWQLEIKRFFYSYH